MPQGPPSRWLAAYVWLISFGGLAISLGVWTTPLAHWSTAAPAVVIALSIALVLGELRPIRVSREDGSVDEFTMSDCFAVALVVAGPLSVALAAQAVAVVADDVRRGKPLFKVSFNLGQYACTLLATRAVYASITGRGVLADPRMFRPGDLAGAIVAAVAFYLVNETLISVVMALSASERVGPSVLRDLRANPGMSGVMLALAPAVAQAVEFNVWLLPMLLLPLSAVHKNAQLAIQRRHQALHDGLTGLGNRELLRQRAKGYATPSGQLSRAAVMLLDLDHFKEINDTLGHHVGDRLLVLVAQRLASVQREADMVARLGGDEFAVFVPGVSSIEQAEHVAARLANSLDDPFELDSVRIAVRASIGIALAPDHAEDIDGLLQRADVAMYGAKERRDTYQTYSPATDSHTVERLRLLGELRGGLARGELAVYYQPKADANSGRIVGLEALARWQHPTRGLLGPEEFIPVAENTGFINALTLEILRQALSQLATWRAHGLDLSVAVNLSARHLGDLDLPGHVSRALTEADVPASRLTLEVTESTIMSDKSRAAAVLLGLRSLGVRLAIDDFGTGYSSLAYLTRLPIDELKIDKSFVMNLHSDSANEIIVRSTIELGHNLGLRVVAEGVEDGRRLQWLAALGCDEVQGYHVSAPLGAESMARWLSAQPAVRTVYLDVPASRAVP